MLVRQVIAIALLATLPLLAAARSAVPQLNGSYENDCAPNDAPAFVIVLPAPAQNAEFWLQANAPLYQIAGYWPHSTELGVITGAARIMLCRKSPKLNCDKALNGSFTVTGKPGELITGNLEASFSGGSSLAFHFHAMPAQRAAPLVCG
jgi:hypothetical protein